MLRSGFLKHGASTRSLVRLEAAYARICSMARRSASSAEAACVGLGVRVRVRVRVRVWVRVRVRVWVRVRVRVGVRARARVEGEEGGHPREGQAGEG